MVNVSPTWRFQILGLQGAYSIACSSKNLHVEISNDHGNWATRGGAVELPVSGDKMLVKKADKSYAKVLTQDTINVMGTYQRLFTTRSDLDTNNHLGSMVYLRSTRANTPLRPIVGLNANVKAKRVRFYTPLDPESSLNMIAPLHESLQELRGYC